MNIEISGKGLSNGLSKEKNGGCEFGPDTSGTATSGIMEAIESSDNGTIILTGGKYICRDRLTVRGGFTIEGNQHSVIVNETKDFFKPFMMFEAYTYSPFLIVDANGRAGISIGERGNNAINIGYLKIYGAGKAYDEAHGSQSSCMISGYNISIGNLDVLGGNAGLVAKDAADVRIQDAQIVDSATGMAISSSEHVSVGRFSVDSCSYCGLQIDASADISARGIVWNNTVSYPRNALQFGMLMGEYSSGRRNSFLDINAKIISTGGTAVKLSNTYLSRMDLLISNEKLSTGGNEISRGIEYGENLDFMDIEATLDRIKENTVGETIGELNII